MKEKRTTTGFEIAVIGMSGRFPGAENLDMFWKNLKNGVESLSFSTHEELKESGLDEKWLDNPNFVRAKGGILEDKEYFDAAFFGYSPVEARIMDPQFRLLHQCLWNALENAGYEPGSDDKVIGLYAGSSLNLNWHARCILSGKNEELGEFMASLLTNKDFLCTTVSYKLNLTGPAVVVQSACSTSLVAIHMACRALLTRECDIALAGGVSVDSGERYGYMFQEGMILSPDGHCRTFDAEAKGTVGGNGVGIVVLKRLKFAQEDGDTIHGVILGSAVNNDGLRKVGFTAPSVEGQSASIKAALHIARVEPETITYIETHGTATTLGDPIEIEALKLAFDTDKKLFCRIGSVKSNVGHLDAAAGVTSFIKTVLSLKHRLIPPSLHFENPNPKYNFENSPFFVNTKLSPWENNGSPLRAGVSSFGIGGTNAHIVLEEAPYPHKGDPSHNPTQLILLSAKTPTALDQMTENLVEYFIKNGANKEDYPHGQPGNTNGPGQLLADAAYTLQVGRKAFEHRKIVVCSDTAEAIEALQSPGSGQVQTSSTKVDERPVVFMFPGLGAQYVNMGLDIYRVEPVFREEMDRCFAILKPIIGFDLKQVIYPTNGLETAEKKINQIEISQLVILIFEYALAKLLMKWGIKPSAMIGYSFGEYTAALLAGIFSLEEALELVVFRGQLIGRLPGGIMLSVPLTKEKLTPLLNSQLSIAIDNGESCVVSGAGSVMEAFEKDMKAKGLLCMRLQGSHAIHSAVMNPILPAFEEKIRQINLNKPKIPFLSNLTGQWTTGEEVAAPGYWVRQLRETVRFTDGINELIKEPHTIFIEIGPGHDLSTLILRYINNSADQKVINLVRHPRKKISDVYYLLHKIGQCWLYGIKPDWPAFYPGEKRQRIPLPGYPFQGQRYWIDADPHQIHQQTSSGDFRFDKQPGNEDWFYIPSWTRTLFPTGENGNLQEQKQWLVFDGGYGVGEMLTQRLQQTGKSVITVSEGKEFAKIRDRGYSINPWQADNYKKLLDELERLGHDFNKVVHCWGIRQTKNRQEQVHEETVRRQQVLGFYSLLHLTKAIGKRKKQGDIEISVITNDMQEVTGQEVLCPGKSTVLGLIKVIPQEQPNIACRSIDLVLPTPGSWQEKKMMDQLENELFTKPLDTVVALRGNNRLIRAYEPVKLDDPPQKRLPLREKGVYLVTGGLGNIGLILAEYLAKSVRARLILTGRAAFPPKEEWENHLAAKGEKDPVSQKIIKLQELENQGGKVLTAAADVADQNQMQEVIRQAEKVFGPLNGVIHGAGVIRGKSINVIREISPTQCEEQFHPKIYGLLTLESVLKDKTLDFCWLLSSLSSVLGGLRFAAYSAANIFMDSFVSWHNQGNPQRWTSILWEGMSANETARAFKRMFALKEVDLLVVSWKEYLKERMAKWINRETLSDQEIQHQEGPSVALLPRPNLMNPYRAPQNPLQEELANIWQKLFGFEKIGIDDDFFELGGDSLRAITVISKIHQKLNVEIPLLEFFNRSTIAEQAGYLSDAEKGTYSPITPVEKKEYYPLSSAQMRFYFLQQMDLKSTSYNQSKLMVMDAKVSRVKLENTIKQLIHRHESLRTSIVVIESEPVQRIHHDVQFTVEFYEMRENEIKELTENFVKSFDLSRAPFLRVALTKLEDSKYILLFDMHHIVTDALSYQVLTNEFLSLYNDRILPELTLQYKDYSEWQNREKERGALEEQEKYWLKTLEGELPVLNLPYDFIRPPVQSFEGSIVDFEIGEEVAGTLKKISRSHDVTLFITLLAIFNILLSKLSGQEDIPVGTPVVGRRQSDLDSIVGIFINTLVLRNYPKRERSFVDFLQEVRAHSLEAFENQEYQFEDLVDKILARRDKSRNPLFDVMFNMQQPVDSEGIDEKKSYELVNKISKFDIQLICMEAGEKIIFTMEYCTKLFKRETIEKFIKYFKEIVSTVAENPVIKLENITIRHELFDQKLNVPETDFAF
ncbi:MAG: SDR family NAD(P)-dependent oxidoreductase [Candidatus Aminicenantes bacterium]|jgi:acyl transferase domain-containing protein